MRALGIMLGMLMLVAVQMESAVAGHISTFSADDEINVKKLSDSDNACLGEIYWQGRGQGAQGHRWDFDWPTLSCAVRLKPNDRLEVFARQKSLEGWFEGLGDFCVQNVQLQVSYRQIVQREEQHFEQGRLPLCLFEKAGGHLNLDNKSDSRAKLQLLKGVEEAFQCLKLEEIDIKTFDPSSPGDLFKGKWACNDRQRMDGDYPSAKKKLTSYIDGLGAESKSIRGFRNLVAAYTYGHDYRSEEQNQKAAFEKAKQDEQILAQTKNRLTEKQRDLFNTTRPRKIRRIKDEIRELEGRQVILATAFENSRRERDKASEELSRKAELFRFASICVEGNSKGELKACVNRQVAVFCKPRSNSAVDMSAAQKCKNDFDYVDPEVVNYKRRKSELRSACEIVHKNDRKISACLNGAIKAFCEREDEKNAPLCKRTMGYDATTKPIEPKLTDSAIKEYKMTIQVVCTSTNDTTPQMCREKLVKSYCGELDDTQREVCVSKFKKD